MLRHIDHLTIVGGDVVEVSPAFDNAEITATNGAQVAYELLTSMVKKGRVDLLVQREEATPIIKSSEVELTLEERLTSEIRQLKNMQALFN